MSKDPSLIRYIVVIRAKLCPVTWVEYAWDGAEGERCYALTRRSENFAFRYDTKEAAQKDADDIFKANEKYGLTTTVQAVRGHANHGTR